MLRFDSTTELKQWLLARDVDVSRWGMGAAKTVRHLFAEVDKGESIIHPDPPLRRVVAVRLVIRRDNRVLIEASQDLHGGRRRIRGRPPSEKMYPGEHYVDAALRCLNEELGIEAARVQLQLDTYRCKQWLGDPASYPSLCTLYTFHVLDADVPDLPQHNFSTVEQATGPGEPVNVHNWEWRRSRNTD